ncbi:MAG: hypothetical protein DCC68_01385 [Planctomycetota bacterium]|nr:MAG: hypothetical protein DCC68_01385 [Planctomycetota bacterium]
MECSRTAPKSASRRLSLEFLEPRWTLDGVVAFNEIHYHPAGAGGSEEFIELHNQMTINMDVSGWRLAGGVNFEIPEGTVIPGRGFLVIAQNPAELQAATGIAGALGPWTGSLDNSAEGVRLLDNSDRVVNEMEYRDDAPWPIGPDGSGATLAKRSRDLASEFPENWTTSAQLWGTPGAANFPEQNVEPITTTIVPEDAIWRYDDTGTDRQTAWRQPGYDDDAWSFGPGSFFAGSTISPMDVSGLALWLDADATHVVKDGSNRVSAWNDLTGTANNTVAQNVAQSNAALQPTWIASAIGDRPAVRFDGIDDLLNNTVDNLLTPGMDRTIIVVGDANDAGDGGSLVTLRRTGAVFNAQIAGTTTYVYTDGQVLNITAPNLLPTIRSPFASVHRVSGGVLTVDINGETKASGTIQRPENGLTGFTIGNREDHPSQRWNGDIAEVLIYNRNLSAAELGQINTYLNEKYSLAGTKTQLALGPTTDYFRHEFQFNGDPALAELRILAAVDDGAVFYLNGQEIHRQNMPAGAVNYDTFASSTVGQPQFGPPIAVPAGILQTGKNVLAVEVHQATAADPDMGFEISMTVTISPPTADAARKLVINEIASATDPQFFVELSNDGGQPIALGGYQIVSSGDGAPAYALPSQMLAAGAQLAITGAELGFVPAEGDRLFLVHPGQSLVADAAIVKNRLRGRSAEHDGEWLYPSSATPGAANQFSFRDEIVINEIMYHHRPKAATPGTPATYETTTLIPFGADWKYNRQGGAYLGPNWHQTNYAVDGTIWRSGQGPIGLEAPGVLPVPIATTLPSYTASTRTYYFQKEFAFAGTSAGAVVQLRHLIDDGAVFYLNGAEIPGTRFMIAPGTLTDTTLASPGIDNATIIAVDIPANLFNIGSNILSVEVRQNSAISSDIVFGLELVAQQETAPAIPGEPFEENSEEWIELFNRSAAAVDISGWRLDDAIGYTFETNTILGPGEYLVVAADAATLAARYPTIRIAGSYSGSLANSNERIVLRDAAGNPADEVPYYDDGAWPEAADGQGSSLELRDPDADNSRGESWAASDETARGAWQTMTYTGVAQPSAVGPDGQWNEFVLGLLDEGEVLLDDLHVVQSPNGAAIELLQNGTFENDVLGSNPASWRVLGTHGSHGQSRVVVDPDDPTNHVLRLVATGPSEQMMNHAETTLKNGANFIAIQNGTEYRISFRAKPISGLAQVNTRLYFNRLAQTNVLSLSEDVGTPGTVNSRYVANAGPTYRDLVHAPAVPQPGENVIVSVAASDPDGVAGATLWYSVAGGAWNSVAMTQSGGFYRGTIPGQTANSVVQFYVAAVDGLGASSTYPAAGPQSRALVRFDDGLPNSSPLDEFRMIMTAADATFLHQPTNALSNDLLGATVVYRGEVFYDVGVRLRGSGNGRGQDVRYGYNLRFQPDKLFRGVYDGVAVDRSSPFDVSSRELLVKYAANLAGHIPGTYDDLIRFVAPRSQQNGDATLMLDRYDDNYLDTLLDDGSDGTLFELEAVYYPRGTVDGNIESLKVPYPASSGVVGIGSLSDMGDDKERYRHTYLIHNNRDRDDYTRIIQMAKTFGLSGQALLTALPDIIDVDSFLRVYALENLFGMEDTYVTGGLLHNVAFFVRPEDGRVMMFPFDVDYAFAKSTTGPLVQNGDLQEMMAVPAYAHAYYGHLHDIITKSFNSAYVSTWVAYFDSLLAESFAGFGSYINARSSSVSSQLNSAVPNVAFNITTPDSTVNSAVATIAGTGWINVREIRRAGDPSPLPITWNTVTGWSVTVPVEFGPHPVTLEAYGFQGKLIASDTVTIDSTMSSRPLQDFLRVSELMYHPADPSPAELAAGFGDADDFEFLELINTSTTATLDLSGVEFIQGITFDFAAAAVSSVAPGQRLVIVEDAEAFAFRYPGVSIAGQYSGRLDNAGETLTIADGDSAVVQTFTYDDTGESWHPTTDGLGYSLTIRNPLGPPSSWSDGAAWKPSASIGGSPGGDDVLDGDVDGDGSVSLVDLAILQSHFGTTAGATRATGDLDGDGAVDRMDASLLARNFGRTSAALSPIAFAPAAIVRNASSSPVAGAFAVARHRDVTADVRREGSSADRLAASRRSQMSATQTTPSLRAIDEVLSTIGFARLRARTVHQRAKVF